MSSFLRAPCRSETKLRHQLQKAANAKWDSDNIDKKLSLVSELPVAPLLHDVQLKALYRVPDRSIIINSIGCAASL